MKRNLRLSTLTYVLFIIQSACEKGATFELDFKEFYDGLDQGTVFEDCQRRLGSEADLSLLTSDPEQKALYLEALNGARAGLEGCERRKLGIERSGLLLLAAYTIEIIQQFGWDTQYNKDEMDLERE